jgi:hypothetical protein
LSAGFPTNTVTDVAKLVAATHARPSGIAALPIVLVTVIQFPEIAVLAAQVATPLDMHEQEFRGRQHKAYHGKIRLQ